MIEDRTEDSRELYIWIKENVKGNTTPFREKAKRGPRGKAHTYWNPGPGPVRYLLVMTANIYRLIQAIHAMPDRNPIALREVFRKFDSELL